MWEDPIVANVQRTREQLAAAYNFDVKAIFADMCRRQEALGERLVRQKRRGKPPVRLEQPSITLTPGETTAAG